MRLTVKEMEVLCVLHAGTLSATLDVLRSAAAGADASFARMEDIMSLVDKLSRMREGDVAVLAFE